MYPDDNPENFKYIDLNYMNIEKEELPKVKRISQIKKIQSKIWKNG